MSEKTRFNRRAFLKTSGAAGAVIAAGGLVGAHPGRDPGAKESEVLVGVSAGAGDPERAVARYVPGNAEVVHKNETLRYVAVKFPEQAPDVARENFINAITKKDGIKYAEVNETLETQLTPNDPLFGDQYVPQQVGADQAWDVTLGCPDVTVAVIDTGTQYDHPDLADGYGTNPGYDFADDDSDPYPDALSNEYHGTHVAGIACGRTDNGEGIAGISNCSLLNGRALDESGSGSTADIADAIEWAADRGADVINMSLGGGGYTSTMKNAVSYAYGQGCLIVCAAGNDGSGNVSYPAAYEECVAVSAVDSDGSLASFSQYGSSVELAAPGVGVLSTTTDARGSYEQLSGTSMAAPVVSGVAGLALCQWPDLTNAELRTHLKETAKDIGLPASQQGSGQVDAATAVTTVPSPCGDATTTTVISDELSGSADSDCWMREWEFANPCRVTVELTGPTDADFDLYVEEGDGYCPTTSDYDYRGFSTDSNEVIVIDDPNTSSPLFVRVDSWNGSGDYDLTITEAGL